MKEYVENFLAIDPEMSGTILNSLRDQICLIDAVGIIRFVNKEWIRLTLSSGGTLASNGIGSNYLQQCENGSIVYQGLQAILAGGEDYFNFEYPCHSPSEKRWYLMQATPLQTDGKVRGAVIRHVDITKQKLYEFQLKEHAEKDSLTSLFNRRYFEEQLIKEVSHAIQNGLHLSFLYIDADDFKSINDTYGHFAGDQVLKELANRIGLVLRSSDTAARIGGDEFAILLPNTNETELAFVADRLIQFVQQLSIQNQNYPIEVTVLIGGKSFINDFPLNSMMEWVDQALYAAKAKGKNQAVIM